VRRTRLRAWGVYIEMRIDCWKREHLRHIGVPARHVGVLALRGPPPALRADALVAAASPLLQHVAVPALRDNPQATKPTLFFDPLMLLLKLLLDLPLLGVHPGKRSCGPFIKSHGHR